MKKSLFIHSFIFCCFVFFAAQLHGGGSELHTSHSVIQSLKIIRLNDGKILYEERPLLNLIPASVMKIITSAASLARLGPSYSFTTSIYRTGELKHGAIKGDLVIVGGGDPLLVSENLWQIAADLKHLGIETVNGNLVIDNQLFTSEKWDESRMEGLAASENAYDAPVSAFAVNFNTFAIAVAPGESIGHQARVRFDPYLVKSIILENHVKTSHPSSQAKIWLTRVTTKQGNARVIVKGNIPLGAGVKKFYRSVSDPVLASGEIVRSFLENQGIRILGHIKEDFLPKNATLLLAHKGKTLAEITKGLNYYSNNYIADVLVKRLGAAFPSHSSPMAAGSGNDKNGLKVLEEFLRHDIGITSDFHLANGSGLNTKNRISADILVSVLAYMAKRSDLFPEFWSSLPSAGFTGSLSKRFYASTTQHLRGQVRAKTGSLSEPVMVSSLAGYIATAQHGLCAFAVIQNGKSGEQQPSLSELQRSQEDGLVRIFKKI